MGFYVFVDVPDQQPARRRVGVVVCKSLCAAARSLYRREKATVCGGDSYGRGRCRALSWPQEVD